MSDAISLDAEIRERAGKGAARAVRRAGRVPAVIYGDKKDPVMISLDPKELKKQLYKEGFLSSVFEIKAGKDKHRVLARDVQLHPVTDQPLHVDFMRIAKGATVTVEVAVHFENETKSPGLKRGGVLNIVRHEVELVCPADSIPTAITADLSGLDVGDSVHISNVTLPKDVHPSVTDRDFTIATIAAPSSMKQTAEEGEGEEEGEEEEAE